MKRLQFSLSGVIIAICFAGALSATIVGWKPGWREEHAITISDTDHTASGVTASPDGRLLLLQQQTLLTPEPPSIWDVESGTRVTSLSGPISGEVRFSADGRKLFEYSYSGGKTWDTATGKVLGSFMTHGSGFMEPATLSPDCSLILAVDFPDESVIPVRPKAVAGTSGTSSRKSAASPPNDKEETPRSKITVWSVSSDKLLATKELQFKTPPRLIWSADSTRIIAVGNKTVIVLDASTLHELGKITVDHRLEHFHISENGHILTTSSGEETIEVWDLLNFKQLGTIESTNGAMSVTELSPDGSTVITSSDSNISVWDTPSCKCRGDLSLAMNDHVTRILFSRDSAKIAVGSLNGTIRLYNAYTAQHTGGINFPMLKGPPFFIFLANDRLAATSGKNLYIYRLSPGEWWRQFTRLEVWTTLLFGVLFFSRVWAFLSSFRA